MRIDEVRALQLRIGDVEDICDGTQDVLVVTVGDGEGSQGLGEVVSSSYVARAIVEAPRSGGGRHGLAALLRGRELERVEDLWDAMWEGSSWYGRRGAAVHAMAGVDVALWDLKARARGVPLHALLADRPLSGPIPAYASALWGDTEAATEELARELRGLGFGAVKFGFGPIGASLESDRRMVRAARRALGEDCRLMVDVGRRWTRETALERCRMLADHGVDWVEEPLHPEDLEGYARLCADAPLPVAAAETEETVDGFVRFLDAGVSVVQPDLGRVGLTQALRISAIAQERGARCVPHCFGTGINTTASIHWMVAVGGGLVEYPMRTNALCRRLARGVPALEAGGVSPGAAPGLGLDLDLEVVREFGVAGAGTGGSVGAVR